MIMKVLDYHNVNNIVIFDGNFTETLVLHGWSKEFIGNTSVHKVGGVTTKYNISVDCIKKEDLNKMLSIIRGYFNISVENFTNIIGLALTFPQDIALNKLNNELYSLAFTAVDNSIIANK